MRIVKTGKSVKASTQNIFAAGEDDEGMDGFDFDDESIGDDDGGIDDTLEGIADDIEDIQDDIDDIQEDDVNIEVDNNIDGHYIAECDRCHGIFISAVTQSDQILDSIKGVCPLCEKESEQYLKWVINKVENI